jgi:hypothetical protein
MAHRYRNDKDAPNQMDGERMRILVPYLKHHEANIRYLQHRCGIVRDARLLADARARLNYAKRGLKRLERKLRFESARGMLNISWAEWAYAQQRAI